MTNIKLQIYSTVWGQHEKETLQMKYLYDVEQVGDLKKKILKCVQTMGEIIFLEKL